MGKITIQELEVFYRVGITEEERSRPQRLLITVEITMDFSPAIATDLIDDTIDYKALSDGLVALGKGRSWHLIEKVADTIANSILESSHAHDVLVEVKKFVIPEAKYVSVSLNKTRDIT